MLGWFRKRAPAPARTAGTAAERVRQKYLSFHELLELNTECLEVIVGLQEDLQFIPPRRDVVEGRVAAIFEKTSGIVAALDRLTGFRHDLLYEAVKVQRNEVERHIAALQELENPRLAASLQEVGLSDASEVGGKAAGLGEIKNKLGLPVPNGFVMTTEAYRLFCGIPHWKAIRDAISEVDPNDHETLRTRSAALQQLVMSTPLPRAVEVAITSRAAFLGKEGQNLAVRSSAVGEGPEGGSRTYAGQFLTLLNIPPADVVDAYKRVVAGRFSERALAYRLSTGLLEVESPLAVLVLPVIEARASGVMYTRDPGDPTSTELWVTATTGLGLDIAAGRTPADLFIVARKGRRQLIDMNIARKEGEIRLRPEGGIEHHPVEPEEAVRASIPPNALRTLAEFGVALEDHFNAPQDVEWAMDSRGQIWILQTRPLALVEQIRTKPKAAKVKVAPLITGGRTIYPGRVSGRAFLAEDQRSLNDTPRGAIVFLKRASPEIVRVFPRISGLVAEWGNVAGHAAALLREFKIPSVFLMEGAFERVHPGDPVSLDSVQTRVFPGTLFERRVADAGTIAEQKAAPNDTISRNILTLHLLDPAASNFRPSGCKSTHDVLRYCHEKSVEAMFTVNDIALEQGRQQVRNLKTELPLNLCVLDLGGGLRMNDPAARDVLPHEIVSLPFQALWRGVSHPGVSWKREMPAGLSDLVSVMATSLKPQEYPSRPLGQKSYLLAAGEYMNLNARLAYHFTLVDASLTDTAGKNYVAFRFAGGGASRYRRNLRAIFVGECLRRYGFLVDRRGDLLNAWLKKAPAPQTFDALDILGRLLASTSQLDMYMTSEEVMKWYVQQFLAGNYRFHRDGTAAAPAPPMLGTP